MVYQIVNVMTFGAEIRVLRCGHLSYIVKINYLLLYSNAQIRQIGGIVRMSKEGFIKIVNFFTPREGILVLGHGQISYIKKMHFFFKNLFTPAYIRQIESIVMMTTEDFI